jgi:hypothetical protein
MNFKAQINGTTVKNPFVKIGILALGALLGLSAMRLLVLPMVGVAVLIGAGTLLALPVISRFGKILKIEGTPKNFTPPLPTASSPRFLKLIDPPDV